jgi:hypothetical protein
MRSRKKGRGGPRLGSGRPRKAPQEKRDQIVHEYELLMELRAAAIVIAREREKNPIRKKRWAIDRRMREISKRHYDHRIPSADAKKLIAELESAGEPPPFPVLKRAKGYSAIIKQDLSKKYGFDTKTITSWINEARAKRKPKTD